MFELATPHTLRLVSVTPRSEHHGEEETPAVSLGLVLETTDAILDQFDPKARMLLGWRAVSTIALKTVCQGWNLAFDYGIDEDSPVVLTLCKLDKFRVEPKNDGVIALRFRCGTSEVDPENLGFLASHVGQEVTLTARAPAGATQTDDEPTAKALKKQAAQEEAGQTRIDGDEPTSTIARMIKRDQNKRERKAARATQ